jgi:ubiquitin-protein ligase
MPQLPLEIWKRRLESEFLEMRASGENFEANAAKTEYTIVLKGEGLEEKENGAIAKRYMHQVKIILKREYPYAGGIEVYWLTPIFHPNISDPEGVVCIQLLNVWNEGVSVKSVVDGLKQLLQNPNPLDPLNKRAAKYFLEKETMAKTEDKKPRIV